MLIEERQRLLGRGVSFEKLPKRLKSECAVGEGCFAGFVDRFAGMPRTQAQQALKHANALNSAVFQHRLSPGMGVLAENLDLAKQPRRPTLDAADLLRCDVFA